MMKQLNYKVWLIFLCIAVVAVFSYAMVRSGNVNNTAAPTPRASYNSTNISRDGFAGARTHGIAATFLKKTEIMSRANWSSPPLSVEEATSNLSKYDAIWCSQLIAKNNPQAWRDIRKNHPEKLMLRYVSGCSTYPDGDFTSVNYDYINANHPEWFLLADSRRAGKEDCRNPDKRARWNSKDKKHAYYNRFYLDVANKEFQAWGAKEILSIVRGDSEGRGVPYDGVALDNVYVGRRLHERFGFTYPNWKYANNYPAWSKGYGDYLKTIKRVLNEHGFIIVANHNPAGDDRSQNDEVWRTLYDSVDGILTERALRDTWRNAGYLTGDKWLAAITRNEELSSKGLINWWVCSPFEGDKIDRRAFLYTYCSWLLIKQPEKSYYSFIMSAKTDTVPWSDELDLPIGEPVSSRYSQNNCWIRDYTNAKIIVNPTRTSQTFAINDTKVWLDWESKKTGNEFRVGASGAKILLPTEIVRKGL